MDRQYKDNVAIVDAFLRLGGSCRADLQNGTHVVCSLTMDQPSDPLPEPRALKVVLTIDGYLSLDRESHGLYIFSTPGAWCLLSLQQQMQEIAAHG